MLRMEQANWQTTVLTVMLVHALIRWIGEDARISQHITENWKKWDIVFRTKRK